MPKCGSDRDGDCLCLPVEHNPGEPDRICVKDHGYCVDCDTCREELGGYCLVRSRCFNCPTACAIPCGTPFPRVEGDDGSVVLPSPIATSPP